MEFEHVVRARRMVRSFSDRPIPPAVLDGVLGAAARAPSAGFTQAVDLLVLEGADEVGAFFSATSEPSFLEEPGAMAGLLRAPVVVLPLTEAGAYARRYGEPDKATSGLAGRPLGDWEVPYWLVDASFATMLLLLAATDAGLGALFFRLHVDPGPFLEPPWRARTARMAIGAVALGHLADDDPGPAGSPARRRRRDATEVVHRGRW